MKPSHGCCLFSPAFSICCPGSSTCVFTPPRANALRLPDRRIPARAPGVVFWTVALTQAALWTLVPALFYSAPPGDVPLVLAIGHEFVLGSYLGPPLAFWLGEIAFGLAGTFGLYVLAQACIVVTYWAVFTLGRAIVGTRHAVLAVLLMVGIAAFTVPSPNFGPAILAAPLWALALLHYWRAVGEGRRGYWFLLALDLGLLMLASYVGLILLAAGDCVHARDRARARCRAASGAVDRDVALVHRGVSACALALAASASLVIGRHRRERRARPATVAGHLALPWRCVLAHLGLALLVTLASGWPRHPRERAPEIDRNPVESLARDFVYVFALAPALVAIAIVVCRRPARTARPHRAAGRAVGPRGDRRGRRPGPALSRAAGIVGLARPAGRAAGTGRARDRGVAVDARHRSAGSRSRPTPRAAFLRRHFQRRTGKPLAYVTGDPRIAPLVALAAPSRPHVYFAWAPQRSPGQAAADVRDAGRHSGLAGGRQHRHAAGDAQGAIPRYGAGSAALVSARGAGLLPLIRLGWAMLRPASARAGASRCRVSDSFRPRAPCRGTASR